jgi:hypothetical protein
MDNKLVEMQGLLSDNGIIICFSGRFSQGLIEELGEAITKHMESEERPRNNIFSVFSIFIEQSQNIKKYVVSKEKSKAYEAISDSGIVCIGKTNDGYFIRSGNAVENTDVLNLRTSLDRVIGKSKDELKLLFKEQMKKEVEPGKNGAGIGFIDMARKASQPIEYSIKKIDDTYSFYEIRVIV